MKSIFAFLVCAVVFIWSNVSPWFSAYSKNHPVKEIISAPDQNKKFVAVFVTHKRLNYLERSMRSFFAAAESREFDVVVSIDHEPSISGVAELIRRLADEFHASIRLVYKPTLTFFSFSKTRGEQAVDQHIFSAISRIYDSPSHRYGLIIEDDLHLSPDFLEFAIKGAKLLDEDKSLFCLSAWNDNGFTQHASDPKRVLRSSIFPGLGWMVTREVALEIVSRWPGWFSLCWDLWMRTSKASRGRECLAPEIPRVFHFGEGGVHVDENSFFEAMAFSKLPAGLGTFDASLATAAIDDYDAGLRGRLEISRLVQLDEFMKPQFEFVSGETILIPHEELDCKNVISKKLKIFGNEICRMAHRGLFEVNLSEIGSLLFFADRRFGAEWLPERERRRHPSLKPSAAAAGESCEHHCTSKGLICSVVDAAHVNTCAALGEIFGCQICQKTDMRGASFSSGVCRVSNRSGFFCDEIQEISRVCPCAEKPSRFDFEFNFNH